MACGCQHVPVITDPFGIEWYGVPGYVRVAAWLVALYRGKTDVGLPEFWAKWAGCGCVRALKDRMMKWHRRITNANPR